MALSYSLASGIGPLPATRLARHRARHRDRPLLRRRDHPRRCSSAAAPATTCVCATCAPTPISSAACSASASPAASTPLGVSICHLIYLRVILHLGDVAAAAHGVAIQVEAIGFMPGGAFQIAASTMTGQYLGAGDLHRARHSVLIACGVATVVMIAAGVVFYFAAAPISAFFLGGYKSNVLPLCVELLHVIAFVMLPLVDHDGPHRRLRGAGDTRWPLAITLFGFIVIRVPLAIYFVDDHFTIPLIDYTITGLGLGVVGAWYAAIIDVTVRAALLTWRFFHGGWQRIEV